MAVSVASMESRFVLGAGGDVRQCMLGLSRPAAIGVDVQWTGPANDLTVALQGTGVQAKVLAQANGPSPLKLNHEFQPMGTKRRVTRCKVFLHAPDGPATGVVRVSGGGVLGIKPKAAAVDRRLPPDKGTDRLGPIFFHLLNRHILGLAEKRATDLDDAMSRLVAARRIPEQRMRLLANQWHATSISVKERLFDAAYLQSTPDRDVAFDHVARAIQREDGLARADIGARSHGVDPWVQFRMLKCLHRDGREPSGDPYLLFSVVKDQSDVRVLRSVRYRHVGEGEARIGDLHSRSDGSVFGPESLDDRVSIVWKLAEDDTQLGFQMSAPEIEQTVEAFASFVETFLPMPGGHAVAREATRAFLDYLLATDAVADDPIGTSGAATFTAGFFHDIPAGAPWRAASACAIEDSDATYELEWSFGASR